MFDTPLAAVTYEQVLDFCKTFPEGVRVEYKVKPVNIPKIISSFANTVGGIWIIGVKTDKTTNMAQLPLAGMPCAPGVEEQIVQSAQTGIYPAITPAVRVFDVPDQPDRIVIVVKIPESIEAPHAIENSTRVYMRVASTTAPYDLANIDMIEYLLKRRQEPERRRKELIAQMAERSIYRGHGHKIRVVFAPVYPRGLLLPMDDLVERAETLRLKRASQHLTEFRLIHAGVMSTGIAFGQKQHYFEVDTHGIVFFEAPAPELGRLRDLNDDSHIPFVQLGPLIAPLASVLNTALVLLRGMTMNVLLRYELFGWEGVGFLAENTSTIMNLGGFVRARECLNKHFAVSSTATMENLTERRVEVLTETMRQALHAFNYTNPQLGMLVYTTLQNAGLI